MMNNQLQQISNFKQTDYMRLVNHTQLQCRGIIPGYKLCYNNYMSLNEIKDIDGNYAVHGEHFINLKLPFRFVTKK